MRREFKLSWPSPLPLYLVQDRLVVLLPDVAERDVRVHLTEAVAAAIHSDSVAGLIIDASAVKNADGPLCAAMLRMGNAVRDAGASLILCGLTPYMVATLRSMSFPFSGVATTASLSSGLQLAGLRASDPQVDVAR